ncbi:oligosaccharide biosynthesis protein Alg14 [Enterococcus sp. BWR-S5]|uniref:oligosaccharide biosynthesis protein Alg14 n=1 Tax=Enterococcus sp. BWR-S5 TaxID=2787714 RepID=UPI001924D3F6|nr:oligosaccharide biosynthesis protein Alg14 [Enterococcus sp. BWR-S5]MBL1226225.1 oligosaccharide biosynthesis protein Alg14 [Enterococcus sp. BWR-S5]
MNDRTTLLVAKNEHLYFFDTLSDIDVIAGHQLLRAPWDKTNWEEKLSQYSLIVFLDYGFEPKMAEVIRPYTQAKFVLFFWNHMTKEKIQLLYRTQAEPYIDAYYTFDPLEAQEFHLNHNSTFYSRRMLLPNKELKRDLFFGASDNGRREVAQSLLMIFNYLKLDTHYFILNGRGNEQKGYLSYEDYLNFVAESKGILEIMRPGQTGITLRSLEALFFKKKLVTTNRKIRHYHFYNPENIFIIGEEDFARLPEFLDSPYQDTMDELLEFYSEEQWMSRFHADDTASFETKEYRSQIFNHDYTSDRLFSA